MNLITEIKKTLINDTDALTKVLEAYRYCNIKVHSNYISFGRNEESSAKAIVIYTSDNDNAIVKDYPLNIDNQDIFAYIMQQRHVDFTDVLNTVKATLGIKSYEKHYKPRTAFGGWYDKVKAKKQRIELETYPEKILCKYEPVGNLRFLKDNISLEAQRFFGIRYDIEEDGIIIPIRNEIGSLMGVKIRSNIDSDAKGFLKYYYKIRCKESQTLYGFYENYQYLFSNTIYVFEAEKSVMQCFSYGIRNCVALGSGNISDRQVELLLQLNPKKIIFLHDNNFEIQSILKNINKVKNYTKFFKMPVGYWDYTRQKYPEKCSPSDLGFTKLSYIVENEINWI